MTKKLLDLKKMQKKLIKRARKNQRKVAAAVKTANKAYARKLANVEITISGIFAGETPGNPGGGAAVGINVFFKKWKYGGVGLNARLSFIRYELEVAGLPPNPDVHAQEWDVGLNILGRLQPVKWLYADFLLGVSMRFAKVDDATNWQENNHPYRLIGINGSVKTHAVLNWGVGLYVQAMSNLALGIAYYGTRSFTKQLKLLSITLGEDPETDNVFNHSGLVAVRASF